MRYRTTILEPDGSTAQAVLEAVDEQALHEALHGEGRALVRVVPLEPVAAERDDAAVRLKPRRLLLLTQALAEALDAGVPLLGTFAAIAEQEEDPRVEAMLLDVGDRVRTGQPLSDALAGHPRAFPQVYCALVRAGEQSGSLPQVLRSVAGFLEWRMEVAATVRQAMVYPLLVGTAGYAMVLFLMSFVIPRLGSVLDHMSGALPAASVALIGASAFVASHIVAIVLGSFAAAVAIALLLRTARCQDLAVTLLGRLPVVRSVVAALAAAQFTRTFGVLLEAGLTMTSALQLGGATVSLPALRARVEAARQRIFGGARLGEAFEAEEVLPPVALSMLRVGEEAGRLPVTFAKLGRLYDREVKDSVRRALGLLEPLVTVLLGVVVGGVAVLVVVTIYSAMKGLGR